jgi:Tfp pilus assembly protein PilN
LNTVVRYNRSVTNLLPIKEFQHVAWEHRRRIMVVILLFVSFSMGLALLFSIPSAIVVWSAANGFADQLRATKTLVSLQRKQGGSDQLADLASRADALEASLLQRTPTSILEDIVPRIPEGIRIQHFAYSPEGTGVSVTILGIAETRNALIVFGDKLRQSPLFSRVDVPVGSLAKSENIDFELTLELDTPVLLKEYLPAPMVSPTPNNMISTTTTPSN